MSKELQNNNLDLIISKINSFDWAAAEQIEQPILKKINELKTNLKELPKSKWIEIESINQQIEILKIKLKEAELIIKEKDDLYLSLIQKFRALNKKIKKELNSKKENKGFKQNSIAAIKQWTDNYFKLKKNIHNFIVNYSVIELNLNIIEQDLSNDFRICFPNNSLTTNFEIERDLKNGWLKSIFSKLPANQSDANAWVKENLNENLKDDNQKYIIKELKNKIQPLLKIAIEYDGEWKNHDDLSGGQKTTYGLKSLLKKQDQDQPLLIDQPEEDFDAETMSTYLSEQLFGQNVKNQVFVVSHMGPLVGESINDLNFIYADLNNQEMPYQVIKDKKQIQAILEGSESNFTNRYNYYQKKG